MTKRHGATVMKTLACRVQLGLLALWFTLSPGHDVAWSQDRPADNAVAAQIADAVAKAEAGKLLDAVEQFQRILDTSGDELVPVNQHHYAPARWVIHSHLAHLPADGIRLYRQRVDGQAAKRLDEAKKSRDDSALNHLLADMFAARASEEAILELARRSFERGEFDAAEHYWKMLLPPVEGDPRLLRFPDPKTDVAAVQARLLLVKLFRGERNEVKTDLKSFRTTHGNATGLLAGKVGKYADTLTEILSESSKTTLSRPPNEPGWPTFAGSSSRVGTLRSKLPYLWPDEPAWKASLPFLRSSTTAPDVQHPRSLAFLPVVSDGRAYVADGARVLAFNLKTGQISLAGLAKGGEDARIPTKQDARYTLTEHDGILYGRFGPAALSSRDSADTFIVAFGPRKDDSEEREALWRLNPPTSSDGVTQFEGAPVVHRDRLYVGLWRQSAGDAVAGVACYRIDDLKTLPKLVWQRIVGKAGSETNGDTRYRHALTTISGPIVVYCTDGGSVVALNANDGKPAWEYRYARNDRPTMPRYRDLCPPLADGGRVYAAPADSDRLFCLDAYTGRLIWEREGVEVVHLLGVARGRLIATFGGQLRGIRGLNLRTGADSGESGWTIHADGGEATFGRGLVTEEAIVWPTKHGLHFLNPADGSPLRSPLRGPVQRTVDGRAIPTTFPVPFGNLCFADGVLLVTTPTEVWGYVSEAKKLSDHRLEIDGDRTSQPQIRLASGNETESEFNHLIRHGALLYGRFGECALARIETFPVVSVRWTLSAPSVTHGVPYDTIIDPNFSTDGAYLVAHISTGKGVVVDAETGSPVHVLPTTRKPWSQPPEALGQSHFFIPDDASVFLFDAKAGKELARHTLPGVDSLTGELPRFRFHQGDPLLIIERNHGVELDRLKIDDLKRAWKREPIIAGRQMDDVAFSGEQFFVAADGMLSAHGWKDGEPQWETPLPDLPHSTWKITVLPQGLLVHPADAVMQKPDFDAVGEFRKAGWNRERLLQAFSKSYDAWTTRELPILVIDTADGRLIQRLNFPAAGPAASVALTPKGVVVVTEKGSWTLSAQK